MLKNESFAHAEIAVQEPALIGVRLFNGQEFQLDITSCLKFRQFQNAQAAGDFLVKALSSALYDAMVLSNLRPKRPPNPEMETEREARRIAHDEAVQAEIEGAKAAQNLSPAWKELIDGRRERAAEAQNKGRKR